MSLPVYPTAPIRGPSVYPDSVLDVKRHRRQWWSRMVPRKAVAVCEAGQDRRQRIGPQQSLAFSRLSHRVAKTQATGHAVGPTRRAFDLRELLYGTLNSTP